MTSPVRASVVAGFTVRRRILSRATGTLTVAVASSEAAWMVAVPGATPVTKPAASTAATDGLSEVHLIFASERGFPFAVRAIAVSFTALPTVIAFAGSISIFAIFDVPTLMVAYPAFPAITAPTVTMPGA